jgi:hypothetical protein
MRAQTTVRSEKGRGFGLFRPLAVVGASALALTLAGVPTAAAAPTPATAQTWEMPSLKGLNLAKAQEVYTATMGDDGPKLRVVNGVVASWTIVAPSMWDVCRQSPAPGKEIIAKSRTTIVVKARGDC